MHKAGFSSYFEVLIYLVCEHNHFDDDKNEMI